MPQCKQIKTMLLVLLFSIFAVISAQTPAKCARKLQAALYEPQIEAKNYLKKLTANLKTGSALLFTPQAASYLAQFEQQWGVNVTLSEAPNICKEFTPEPNCTVFTENQPNSQAVFEVPELQFTYITVTFNGTVTTNAGIGNYQLIGPGQDSIELTLNASNICYGNIAAGSFSIGFADGSTTYFNCASPNSGTVLAPDEPLSTFDGVNTEGNWTLIRQGGNAQFDIANLNFCFQPASIMICSRDVMKALTNIPGFRIDSGMAYYTEDIFDQFGNFKQITIRYLVNTM